VKRPPIASEQITAPVPSRFVALDAWRGVAALMVALFHVRLGSHLQTWPVVQHSFLFVDFFFVLSGFVIHHAYAAGLKDAASLRTFILRRFGRLWPLQAATLLALVLFIGGDRWLSGWIQVPSLLERSPGQFTAGSLIINLLLIQGLGTERVLTWDGPSWSISTEFFTYIAFALVLIAAPRRLRVPVFAAIALASALVIARLSPRYMDATIDYGIFRCFFGFFVGCCTHVAVARNQGWIAGRATTWLEIVAVATAVVFVAYAGARPLGLLSPLAFAAVVAIFSQERGALSRLMQTKFFRAIGERSYSIYLLHALLVYAIWRVFRYTAHALPLGNRYLADGATIATLALLLWLAGLTYRLIEKPGRRWFNALALRI
jgi:peptidoglycan/LPS O-acetylase OafA/YrhL